MEHFWNSAGILTIKLDDWKVYLFGWYLWVSAKGFCWAEVCSLLWTTTVWIDFSGWQNGQRSILWILLHKIIQWNTLPLSGPLTHTTVSSSGDAVFTAVMEFQMFRLNIFQAFKCNKLPIELPLTTTNTIHLLYRLDTWPCSESVTFCYHFVLLQLLKKDWNCGRCSLVLSKSRLTKPRLSFR